MSKSSHWHGLCPDGGVQVDQGLRAFMLGVYNNMILGLAISAAVALGVNMLATSSEPTAIRMGGVYLTEFGRLLYGSPLMWLWRWRPGLHLPVLVPQDRMSAASARGTFFCFVR